MRICITAFAGWGNNGDEGIIQAMMDDLGDHDYIICTNLPYTMHADYKAKLPTKVIDVRHIYDSRHDYDVFLLGGGGLSWGFGWRQAMNAWVNKKPSMNYGVGFNRKMYSKRLNRLYYSFLSQFDAITVRDEYSQEILTDISSSQIGILPVFTSSCPSINLKEEPFECPTDAVVVCPRYEDDGIGNEAQIDWLTKRLSMVDGQIILVPFAPYSSENVPVDLALCLQLKRKFRNSRIMQFDGFSPRKIKYLISQSRLVISGGRYHAIVWAGTHNVPFEVSPTSAYYPKVGAFMYMHHKYGIDKLKEMEKANKKWFMEVTEWRKQITE